MIHERPIDNSKFVHMNSTRYTQNTSFHATPHTYGNVKSVQGQNAAKDIYVVNMLPPMVHVIFMRSQSVYIPVPMH